MRKFLSSFPKWLVFAVAGLLGAGIFNAGHELMAFLFFPDRNFQQESLSARVLYTGLWFCFPSVGVVLLLFLCQSILLGAKEFLRALLVPLTLGVVLGFVSGALAEGIFQTIAPLGSSRLTYEAIRVFVWGLAGGALGISLSFAIHNLKGLRAFFFGIVGGVAGGVGFVIVAAVIMAALSSHGSAAADEIASVVARLVGTSIIGLFVGLSVAVAEATAKEGHLRVVWGPGEFTRVNLGMKPVIVGSSREATVRLSASAGYPPVVATFSLQNGQATMVNHMSKTTHALKNGNKLTLGQVVIEVHLFS